LLLPHASFTDCKRQLVKRHLFTDLMNTVELPF
jgi:hypothetical protein